MSASLDALRPICPGEGVRERAGRRGAAMTEQQTPPREESTFGWLWRFGLVRSVLAIGFIGMTLLQSALEILPDPSEQQWNLAELAFVFYFATAADLFPDTPPEAIVRVREVLARVRTMSPERQARWANRNIAAYRRCGVMAPLDPA